MHNLDREYTFNTSTPSRSFPYYAGTIQNHQHVEWSTKKGKPHPFEQHPVGCSNGSKIETMEDKDVVVYAKKVDLTLCLENG